MTKKKKALPTPPTDKTPKLPISSMLINQITEFSPDGFFLLIFSAEGEPKTLEISTNNIGALALEHALFEIVQEKKIKQKIILEERVYDELIGDDEGI